MTTRELAAIISQIPPSTSYKMSYRFMRDIEIGVMENNYNFPKPDWVLEHIMGAAYEFGYFEDIISGNIEFFRLKEPLTGNRRTYVSPDHRHAYQKTITGIYEPK